MNRDEIIETLKTHYSRDIRKQLIKALLKNEKSEDKIAVEKQYKIINQIFNYVLKESNWKMGENTEKWDASPLTIMTETFPRLDTSKWYEEQHILTKQHIAIQMDEKEK